MNTLKILWNAKKVHFENQKNYKKIQKITSTHIYDYLSDFFQGFFATQTPKIDLDFIDICDWGNLTRKSIFFHNNLRKSFKALMRVHGINEKIQVFTYYVLNWGPLIWSFKNGGSVLDIVIGSNPRMCRTWAQACPRPDIWISHLLLSYSLPQEIACHCPTSLLCNHRSFGNYNNIVTWSLSN